MKVPPRDRGKKAPSQAPLSGDQLIRDYLTRVAQAGLWLPKGVRMAFIGREQRRKISSAYPAPSKFRALHARSPKPRNTMASFASGACSAEIRRITT